MGIKQEHLRSGSHDYYDDDDGNEEGAPSIDIENSFDTSADRAEGLSFGDLEKVLSSSDEAEDAEDRKEEKYRFAKSFLEVELVPISLASFTTTTSAEASSNENNSNNIAINTESQKKQKTTKKRRREAATLVRSSEKKKSKKEDDDIVKEIRGKPFHQFLHVLTSSKIQSFHFISFRFISFLTFDSSFRFHFSFRYSKYEVPFFHPVQLHSFHSIRIHYRK